MAFNKESLSSRFRQAWVCVAPDEPAQGDDNNQGWELILHFHSSGRGKVLSCQWRSLVTASPQYQIHSRTAAILHQKSTEPFLRIQTTRCIHTLSFHQPKPALHTEPSSEHFCVCCLNFTHKTCKLSIHVCTKRLIFKHGKLYLPRWMVSNICRSGNCPMHNTTHVCTQKQRPRTNSVSKFLKGIANWGGRIFTSPFPCLMPYNHM